MARTLENAAARTLEDLGARDLESGTGNSAPVIDTQPVDASVPAGDNAVFTVVASDPDLDPLTYQWYETPGDTLLPGETAATLTIPTITMDDGRQFYCVVDDGVI